MITLPPNFEIDGQGDPLAVKREGEEIPSAYLIAS
jgi:hypothetical protein